MTAPPPEPLVVGPLTRTDIVRYQGASGDMNPLHHDEPFARVAGYDAPLVIGMLGAGLLGSYATDWLGASNVRRFRIRFRAQVWPGDTLTCTGHLVKSTRVPTAPSSISSLRARGKAARSPSRRGLPSRWRPRPAGNISRECQMTDIYLPERTGLTVSGPHSVGALA